MDAPDLTKAVADKLAMTQQVQHHQKVLQGPAHPEAALKLPAIDWHQALSGADDFLGKYLPTLGPLAPAQVQALVGIIAEFIHLANQQANGPVTA